MIKDFEMLQQKKTDNYEAKKRLKDELDKQAMEFKEKKRRTQSEMKQFALMVEANDEKLLDKEIERK
jgi:hypothetical protein